MLFSPLICQLLMRFGNITWQDKYYPSLLRRPPDQGGFFIFKNNVEQLHLFYVYD